MKQRALIVLLVVMNVGVAAWWAARPPHVNRWPAGAPGARA